MSFTYNGTEMQGVTYNGAEVQSITYNGVEVWSALPPPGKTLNEYTWDEIKKITQKGLASQYFSVGNQKDVQLSITGKMGGVAYATFDGTYKATILGFNHNAAKESGGKPNVHFAFFPSTSTSIRYNVVACKCGDFSATGNISWSNPGWVSDMVGVFLKKGQFYENLPTDLKSVISETPKYYAGKSNSASVSNDYVFIPDAYEVFGATGYSAPILTSYEKQYDYFKTYGCGSGKYWFRSSVYKTWQNNDTTLSCGCNNRKNVDLNTANKEKHGIVPIFSIY